MTKIKVTSKSFSKNETLKKQLRQNFSDCVFNEQQIVFNDQQLVEYLSDADGAIVALEKLSPKVLDQLPNLKIISKYGVGLDGIDVEYARSIGKVIGWEGGVNKRSVSELALGFMLGQARNIFYTSTQLRSSNWDKQGGWQLSEKTIGIVGCGHIGKDLVHLLQPFHCKILVSDILDLSEWASDHNVQQVSLEELLEKSDVVSLHVPLTEKTKHLINTQTLKLMPQHSFLVNTSRGPVVNLSDLKQALKNHKIAGAALDVFDVEPPTDTELLQLPNFVGTPHIGGNASEAVEAMGLTAIKHLVEFFK